MAALLTYLGAADVSGWFTYAVTIRDQLNPVIFVHTVDLAGPKVYVRGTAQAGLFDIHIAV